eukprot:SAG22_NODE_15854_length_338_cov_1.673640_1_plen_68_part_10
MKGGGTDSEGGAEVALDAAEADDDVLARVSDAGRVTAPLVGPGGTGVNRVKAQRNNGSSVRVDGGALA